MTVGGNGKLYVKTADGKAPGRVQIFSVVDGQDDVLLGTTNAAGVLVTEPASARRPVRSSPSTPRVRQAFPSAAAA